MDFIRYAMQTDIVCNIIIIDHDVHNFASGSVQNILRLFIHVQNLYVNIFRVSVEYFFRQLTNLVL